MMDSPLASMYGLHQHAKEVGQQDHALPKVQALKHTVSLRAYPRPPTAAVARVRSVRTTSRLMQFLSPAQVATASRNAAMLLVISHSVSFVSSSHRPALYPVCTISGLYT